MGRKSFKMIFKDGDVPEFLEPIRRVGKRFFKIVVSTSWQEPPKEYRHLQDVIVCKNWDEVGHHKNCSLIAYNSLNSFQVLRVLDQNEIRENVEHFWNIGGQRVYEMQLKSTVEVGSRIYLTKIVGIFGCDLFFPEKTIIWENWREIDEKSGPDATNVINEENGLKYTFRIFERK